MAREIDYGNLMHAAMRGLIRTVLEGVEAEGLPGAHHFFITFDTTHPGVQMADRLADRYPAEMTVVLQHWYDNLDVGEDGFAITLNFGDMPEPLYIPYTAIRTFVDPSVEFGLRFEAPEDDEEDDDEDVLVTERPLRSADRQDGEGNGDGSTDPDRPRADAEIVSLDKFRK
ncbi:SspB family protein [Chachezhania sediminis]|uniref:SspB family protein n=1 Tax=Chachezhania sediminis TaxID=2599291 RepID=UPI00131C54A8|nr:ClpXP protease specificity-enhancing factor SspB [Chachezhania sediminis]